MDIFSVGCVIAEIILDGSPLFNLSSLLQYRKGEFDIASKLEKVGDPDIKDMILTMVAREPSQRPDVEGCLDQWQGKVFPEWFYTPLYSELLDVGSALPYNRRADPQNQNNFSTTHGSPATIISMSEMDGLSSDEAPGIVLHTSDGRIARLYHHWPVLASQLSLCPDLHIEEANVVRVRGPNDAAVIIFTFASSYIRNCAYPHLPAAWPQELILSLSHSLSDNITMDRLVPLVVMMATRDEAATVRVTAIFALRVILTNINTIRPVDSRVFEDYLIPQLTRLATDPEPVVRIALARAIADFLETAYRFVEMTDESASGSQSLSSTDSTHGEFWRKSAGASQTEPELFQNDYEGRLASLQLQFRDTIGYLLADPNSEVKRALLVSFPRLCFFFHQCPAFPAISNGDPYSPLPTGTSSMLDIAESDAKDFLLSHIITYLNDRDSWLLRSHFFEAVVGVALLVGRHALEEYILPLMSQAMGDSEEFVIGSVIKAFTRLAEAGLLGCDSIRDRVRETAPLLVHPNKWLKESSIGFIEAACLALPSIDHYVVIVPATRPCLRYEISTFTRDALEEALDTPVEHAVYQEAVQLVMTLGRSLPESTFGPKLKHLASSSTNIDSYPLLHSLPINECHKLTVLKRYIDDAARNLQRQNMQLINRNDGPEDGLNADGIQLKNVGVTLHTVFLSPEDAKKPISTELDNDIVPKDISRNSYSGRPSFSSGVPTASENTLDPINQRYETPSMAASMYLGSISSAESPRRRHSNASNIPFKCASPTHSVPALKIHSSKTDNFSLTESLTGSLHGQRSKRAPSYTGVTNAVATAVPPSSGISKHGKPSSSSRRVSDSAANDTITLRHSDILSQLQRLTIDYASPEHSASLDCEQSPQNKVTRDVGEEGSINIMQSKTQIDQHLNPPVVDLSSTIEIDSLFPLGIMADAGPLPAFSTKRLTRPFLSHFQVTNIIHLHHTFMSHYR